MRKRGGLDEGRVEDAHTMVDFVTFANPTEDADGVGDGRLVDDNLGETTLEGCIFFDVLAVFGVGRGADAAELAACEEGFEEVRGVCRGLS